MSVELEWKQTKQDKLLADRRPVKLVFLFGLLAAFGPLTIDMYLPAFPVLAFEFGTSASMVQLSLTACLLGLALGQLLAGPLSDVLGRRKPLIIALICYSLASFLCALAPTVWIFVCMRFIQGVAGAAGLVISRACVRDLYSGPAMTKFYSMLMLVTGVAPILAPVIGSQLLQFVPWQGLFAVLGLLGVGMFFFVLMGLPETLAQENRSNGGVKNTLLTFSSLIKDKGFIGFVLTMGLVSGAMFSYISGSSFVLQEIFGLSPQGYSYVFALNGLGIIIATQVTGFLAGKINEYKLLAVGLSLAACGGVSLFLVTLFDGGLALLMISLFFVVSSVGIVNTTAVSLAMQTQAKNAGSASALMGLSQFSIGAGLAPLVGLGGSATAVPMGIIIAGCEVCALLIYFFLIRKQRMHILDS